MRLSSVALLSFAAVVLAAPGPHAEFTPPVILERVCGMKTNIKIDKLTRPLCCRANEILCVPN